MQSPVLALEARQPVHAGTESVVKKQLDKMAGGGNMN